MPASIVSELFRGSVVPRGRECCFFVPGNISEILLILSLVSQIIYFISIKRFSSSDNILDHTWFAGNISDHSMCFHMWLVGINSFKLISCVCVALISVLLDSPAVGHPGGGFPSSNLMPFKEACPTLGWWSCSLHFVWLSVGFGQFNFVIMLWLSTMDTALCKWWLFSAIGIAARDLE